MDIRQALSNAAHSGDDSNVSRPLEFLVAKVINSGKPEGCYDDALIECAAASPKSQRALASAKFKSAFKHDFKPSIFSALIAEAAVKGSDDGGDITHPKGLILNASGQPVVNYQNADAFLSGPEWDGIALNEFNVSVQALSDLPIGVQKGEELKDHHDTEIVMWLERRSRLNFTLGHVRAVVGLKAQRNKFNPVRDYLESLPAWDRRPRLSWWLTEYLGVDPGSDEKPNIYAERVGRMWIISAIARIMKPGCKADYMLVLEGPTGIGKSSALRALMPNQEWFSDVPGDFSKEQDAGMKIRGHWIMEIPELEYHINRYDEEGIFKQYLSRQEDRYRPPYGRAEEKWPRTCIFAGTTERSDWLKAETGRRFWPVWCRWVKLDQLKADRDQIWAEALLAYRSGETWYPDTAELIMETISEQQLRHSDELLEESVIAAARGNASPYVYREADGQLIPLHRVASAMGLKLTEQTAGMGIRIAKILRINGWRKISYRNGAGKKVPAYWAPELD